MNKMLKFPSDPIIHFNHIFYCLFFHFCHGSWQRIALKPNPRWTETESENNVSFWFLTEKWNRRLNGYGLRLYGMLARLNCLQLIQVCYRTVNRFASFARYLRCIWLCVQCSVFHCMWCASFVLFAIDQRPNAIK